MTNEQDGSMSTADRCAQPPVSGRSGIAYRLAAVLVTVFVLFSPYLANLHRDYTRYCYLWRASDTLYLTISLVLVAAILVLIGECVYWTRRPLLIRLFDHLLLTAMGVGLLGNLIFMISKVSNTAWRQGGIQVQTAWIVLALVVGFSFGRPHSKLVHRYRQTCLILLPCAPLTLLMLFFGSKYPNNLESLAPPPISCSIAPAKAEREPGGIYVVLFDEWSYERTFEKGSVSSRFPHLAALAGQSTLYHQAYSPAGSTEHSIPGVFFQTNDPVVVDYGRFGFERNGHFVPSREYQSIFSRLAPRGYTSVVMGTSMPHRMLLGDQVDVCRTYCLYQRGHDLATHVGIHLFNALHYSPDLWSLKAYKRLEKKVVHATTRNLISSVYGDLNQIIRTWPSKTFAFAHVLLPHAPAILNPDLSYRSVDETGWSISDLKQYESNLQAMDTMIGRLMDELKRAGKFDNSVIVLLADHTWRFDPDWSTGRLTGPRTHVPLIVKGPFQTQTASVDARYETKDLGALIESLIGEPLVRQSIVMENRRP
jgi:hypothetical protein